MKKTILMLTLFCFAVVGLSAQKAAKPKQAVEPRKEAVSEKQAPPAKYEMVAEDDSYTVYVYYPSKNNPKYIAIDKKTCKPTEVVKEAKYNKDDNMRKKGSGTARNAEPTIQHYPNGICLTLQGEHYCFPNF
jgi:hypothetical protein